MVKAFALTVLALVCLCMFVSVCVCVRLSAPVCVCLTICIVCRYACLPLYVSALTLFVFDSLGLSLSVSTRHCRHCLSLSVPVCVSLRLPVGLFGLCLHVGLFCLSVCLSVPVCLCLVSARFCLSLFISVCLYLSLLVSVCLCLIPSVSVCI